MLVFVQSKQRAQQLFHELGNSYPHFLVTLRLTRVTVYDGINVDVMHAERTAAQRANIIKKFRSGHIWVLICTDLMSRGSVYVHRLHSSCVCCTSMDLKSVNFVINYDFPQSTASYIHRIGPFTAVFICLGSI